jgi:hypothetical protein
MGGMGCGSGPANGGGGGGVSTGCPDHSSNTPHDEQNPSVDGAELPHSWQTIMT